MSAETKKVLEMLAAGKISTEDAERLLDKLSNGPAGQSSQAGATNLQNASGTTAASTGAAAGGKRPKFLRIQVERPGREEVNVRVPLSVARGERHWMAFLPSRVAEKLSEHGIDFGSLDAMSDEEFQAALDRINVDIQKGNGKKVRIYAE
ncbi:MAG TPA: hypothetical protein VKS20_15045 [Candidatus Acidoferrales bacterium]|nr:hypothetical protein [Candidatus Acidoferrales bacterium]